MTTTHRRLMLLLALASATLAVCVAGCGNSHEDDFGRAPNDPAVTGVEPPRASGLRALVGNRSARIFWDDLASVASYRLFRRSGEDAEVELEDALSDTTYFDGGLTNGLVYRYRVAAVLGNGLQGDPSDPIFVVPSAYSVLIEDGDAFANDTNLNLTLNAPGGTTNMRFGETPDLTDADWRSFSGFSRFQLLPGDGLRTVYAQFLDQGGNESQVVSDDVTLDTRAEVLSVTHDAGAAPVAPGTVIRFVVMTGEVNGQAFIDIAGSTEGIELFDDGAHGDGGANDGTYAVDWTVPTDAEVRDAVVFGTFEDAAGNFAEGTATQTLTLNGPPTAVVLNPASNVEATSVDLSWSQNQNGDFAFYQVVRALTSDVLNDPDRVIAVVIDDRAMTSYTDDEVDENAQVFYLVQVIDEFGASTPSNTISVTTPNAPPRPVVLTEDDSTPVSVTMSWTESEAQDFAVYRVLRAVETSPGAFTEVAQFDQRERNTYTDFFAASPDTTYYFYKVLVEDLSGESSESNVISVEVSP